MSEPDNPVFSFRSLALAPDTFNVVRFKGEEHLSECYRYEILLASEDPGIDFGKAMNSPAELTIMGADGSPMTVNGILTRFEQARQFAGLTFYTAILMPRLYWLTLIHKNQVFLDRSIPQIFTELLKDGGLEKSDYELRLERRYDAFDYVCQFRETHLYFMTHWMERLGWYFFFEHGEDGEKLVITDTKQSHSAFRKESRLTYAEPSGLDAAHLGESVQAFVCRQHLIPGMVRTKNYNYQKPSLNVEGSSDTGSPAGAPGEVQLYGGEYQTPDEANRAATIVADEYRCRERVCHAETTVPGIFPGRLFTLASHYRADFNREYLAFSVSHEGNQESFLTGGLGEAMGQPAQHPWYRNSVSAIESELQYRPERKTNPSRFYGTINARIDASGDGTYAELDDHGRYKVVLPFDLAERQPGKASCWLRMMQPYAGEKEGMHFPLRKGTEVLLTFIDGDPNRPVIAGALPNIETPSPVSASNATMNKIATPGGNVIHMEDQQGKERILLHSPATGSWIRIGEKNDPPGIDNDDESVNNNQQTQSADGITINTSKHICLMADQEYNVTAGGDSLHHYKGTYTINTDKDYEESISGAKNAYIDKDQNIRVGGKNDLHVEKDAVETILGFKKTTIHESNEMFVSLTNHNYIGLTNNTYVGLTNSVYAGLSNSLIAPRNSILAVENSSMSLAWGNTYLTEWTIGALIGNYIGEKMDWSLLKKGMTLKDMKSAVSNLRAHAAQTNLCFEVVDSYMNNSALGLNRNDVMAAMNVL